MEWEDFALNAGLFVSLHAFFLTGAALASGAPDGGTAASTAVGRGLGLAAFVALQQARGLPLAAWLGQEAGMSAKQAPVPAVLASPLAPRLPLPEARTTRLHARMRQSCSSASHSRCARAPSCSAQVLPRPSRPRAPHRRLNPEAGNRGWPLVG